MNILFLTSRIPFPPVGGDRVRSFQLLRHLSQRHTITLVTFVENEEQLKAAAAYSDLYHRLVTVPLSRAHSYFNTMLGLASAEPLQAHYYHTPRMHAVLKEEFAKNRYDVALVHMIRMCPYLDDVPVRKVVDLCDALALYHQRATQVSRGLNLATLIHRVEAKRLGAYETQAIRKSDATLFISSVDSPAAAGKPTGRAHLAFQAKDREAVDRLHATATAAGGTDNGRPGERPYHPGYYAAFVLDPAGNNIEFVHHGPATRSADAIRITF